MSNRTVRRKLGRRAAGRLALAAVFALPSGVAAESGNQVPPAFNVHVREDVRDFEGTTLIRVLETVPSRMSLVIRTVSVDGWDATDSQRLRASLEIQTSDNRKVANHVVPLAPIGQFPGSVAGLPQQPFYVWEGTASPNVMALSGDRIYIRIDRSAPGSEISHVRASVSGEWVEKQ